MASNPQPAGAALKRAVQWLGFWLAAFAALSVAVHWSAHEGELKADIDWMLTSFSAPLVWIVQEMPAPLATLIVGSAALATGLLGWSQKRKADQKAEWWRRIQYSIDLITSEKKDEVIVGTLILAHLGNENPQGKILLRRSTPISDHSDRELFRIIAEKLIGQVENNGAKLKEGP
ncbi:hypothetical protein AUR04nite_29010 [Glutamicibacter uratoxydans]|uniref:Uncharacterized protein n=1 Tax=Glutamicibacter uratoxydans TaxID=43667 RepID=A0A4Y4DPU0_GLUUR|nr:hypothetical protein [Glutamicibacter uratoxydans]GED07369.1 hypothetical protein AUR04nite_29010 [Glutamicibacter uratoxydans]